MSLGLQYCPACHIGHGSYRHSNDAFCQRGQEGDER